MHSDPDRLSSETATALKPATSISERPQRSESPQDYMKREGSSQHLYSLISCETLFPKPSVHSGILIVNTLKKAYFQKEAESNEV